METVYISLLLSSISLGFLVRRIESRWIKQLVSSGVGIGAVSFVCGFEVIYPLITILGTYCIVKSRARNTEILSFAFTFLLLLFYRNASFFGFPDSSEIGSGVVMMMTLKLAGLAIDIHDTRKKSSKDGVNLLRSTLAEPGIYEILCFSFCYIGIFTGPVFRLRTYRDFLDLQPAETRLIPWKDEFKKRFKSIGCYLAIFIIASYFFSVRYLFSDDFYKHGFFYKFFYSFALSMMARMRFYCGWLLAECICITAAFGAYPEPHKPRSGRGPTVEISTEEDRSSSRVSFETIKCINPTEVEWCTTMRGLLKNWNMTVQWWLVHYVYKRLPAHLGSARDAAVFVWSAFWHGIYPGYYLSFITLVLCNIAEDTVIRIVKGSLPKAFHRQYDSLHAFFKMRAFEYSCIPFLVLTWKESFRWWSSVYFIGHVVALFIIISGIFTSKRKRTTTLNERNT